MAGHGPAPAARRRRRNEPTRGEWVDVPPLQRPVLPELPRLADGDWSTQTRLSWAAWRTDPVTALYTPADIAYALDTIRLYAVMTPSTASEVRLRMDALGLTPKGKRDLRWRVAPATAGIPEETPPAPRDSSARRARLSVVK